MNPSSLVREPVTVNREAQGLRADSLWTYRVYHFNVWRIPPCSRACFPGFSSCFTGVRNLRSHQNGTDRFCARIRFSRRFRKTERRTDPRSSGKRTISPGRRCASDRDVTEPKPRRTRKTLPICPDLKRRRVERGPRLSRRCRRTTEISQWVRTVYRFGSEPWLTQGLQPIWSEGTLGEAHDAE